MALVRAYCGMAAAETASWLTMAMVDDAGRLLDVRDVSDDPAGYAHLDKVLAARSGGPSSVSVATDRATHLVAQLLAAAHRPLAISDEDLVDNFAERFADDDSAEEIESSPAQRRAVGLARALQAGELSANGQHFSRELEQFRPVLAAHSSVAVGRQAAAVALREVLRELYPAALRAYPDPAETLPLAVLHELPEPGRLGSSATIRDNDVLISQVCATGVADMDTVTAAFTALRVAVSESPRRTTQRALAPAVAETVRQAVAAVRAFDAAAAALVSSLTDRLGAAGPAPLVPKPRLASGGSAEKERDPFGSGSGATPPPGRATTPPPGRATTPPPRRATAPVPGQVTAPPSAAGGTTVARASAPPPTNGYDRSSPETIPAPRPSTETGPPGSRATWPTTPVEDDFALPTPSPGRPAQSGFAGQPPLRDFSDQAHPTPPGPGHHDFDDRLRDDDSAYRGHPADRPGGTPPLADSAPGPAGRFVRFDEPDTGAGPRDGASHAFGNNPLLAGSGPAAAPDAPVSSGRVPPPWLADDMPPEPPPLRLPEEPLRHFAPDDPLTGPLGVPGPAYPFDEPRFAEPRLDDLRTGGATAPHTHNGDGGRNGHWPGSARDTREHRTASGPEPLPESPVDEDLLIFGQLQSAWFTQVDEEYEPTPESWGRLADAGWRAAEQVARPSVGSRTISGLPRRVPQANLVPGSAPQPSHPLRIVRDPESIKDHTSGYFRGWQRGQQIGGFAVGQRDRAAWEFNREQRTREGGHTATDRRVHRP